jgi:hypothetical protein
MGTPRPKLITCILTAGRAAGLIADLKNELGITRATMHKARGIGRTSGRAMAQASEKEILNVIADAGKADELFAWLYERAEINIPHGGIMFMQGLETALPFRLPDLPEEES